MTDLSHTTEPPMPIAQLLTALTHAAREYAAAATPGAQDAVLVIAGPGPGEWTHVPVSLCPARPTSASTPPAARS